MRRQFENMKWDKKAPHHSSFLNSYISNEVMVDGLRKRIGKGYTYRFAIVQGKEWTGFSLTSEKELLINFVRAKISGDKNFTKKNIGDYYLIEQKSKRFFSKLAKLDLQQKSNKELLIIFREFLSIYEAFLAYGPLTGQVISGAITPKISDFLDGKLKNLEIEKKDEYLSQLITPFQDTIQVRQEKDLFKIALRFYQLRNKLNRILKNSEDKRWDKIKIGLNRIEPKFVKAIETHTKKYCWLPVFQESHSWDEAHFLKVITNVFFKSNIINELKKYDQRKSKLKKQKHELIDKFLIPSEIKKAIKDLEEYQYLRTRFGSMMGFINYNILPLYAEIAKRLKLTMVDFKNLTVKEIESCLPQKSKVPYKEIMARKKIAILVKKNSSTYILTGQKARAFLRAEIRNDSTGEINEVSGRTAYPGKVRGIVRVILTPKTMGKMKKGNILVTPMTSTDMIMAIKKAAAIVTDIGGLTCHAAIISREFGIPCVIDTKNASEVFHDGDVVQVDASKGIIKII